MLRSGATSRAKHVYTAAQNRREFCLRATISSARRVFRPTCLTDYFQRFTVSLIVSQMRILTRAHIQRPHHHYAGELAIAIDVLMQGDIDHHLVFVLGGVHKV
jgi:hypothetical protein